MAAADPPCFYVTTPIYYVNDRPHLGHVYTTMVADVLARYHRLRGDRTFFLTGVDEHAAKVVEQAQQRGVSTQRWADENAQAFAQTFAKLEMTNDDFIRTSQERHTRRVQEYVRALIDAGDVYVGDYVGWYDAGQEEYVPENKAKEANYVSPVNGKPLVRRQEKNYFFRLSAYRDALRAHYAENPDFVQPEARRNEMLNRIADSEDVPISRPGAGTAAGGWGIPMPDDPQQTIYVWIDALFNYLTTVDSEARRDLWKAGAVHFIAKDILWFHAVIWPAVLISLRGLEKYAWINLPRTVYSHSYWVSESGEKMSKSLGNFLDPQAIDNYVNEFGLDALRYFLATRGPLGVADATFSPDLFVEVYNADLANTLGNCVSRVSNMIGKYFDGQVPEPGPPVESCVLHPESVAQHVEAYRQAMDRFDLTRAGAAGIELIREVDTYIEQTAPYKLAKDPRRKAEVGTILYHCAEALRIASVMLWPYLPDKITVLWQRLGVGSYAELLTREGQGRFDQWTTWGGLPTSTPMDKGQPLFPRYQVD